MELKGKIVQVLPLQNGTSKSGKSWQSQSFVLETDERYPRAICFEIFGEDRIKDNAPSVNDKVIVSFDLESREYNGRWYTSVRAWKVELDMGQTNTATAESTAQPTPTPAPAQAVQQAPSANTQAQINDEEESDELPF